MTTSRFSDSQIIVILKQAESDSHAPKRYRWHGISSATFYKWRSKFGDMNAVPMARLKKMYAEERLKAEIIAEAMVKKW